MATAKHKALSVKAKGGFLHGESGKRWAMRGISASIHEASNKGHKVKHPTDHRKIKCDSCDYFD